LSACIFFFLSLVENKIDGRTEKKNLVSKMAAILFGDTKRLSMKREAPDKKKITKQTNTYSKDIFSFYYLEKSKKDWLGRCRPPSVAVGAQRFQR
jgi:hypothetical protein